MKEGLKSLSLGMLKTAAMCHEEGMGKECILILSNSIEYALVYKLDKLTSGLDNNYSTHFRFEILLDKVSEFNLADIDNKTRDSLMQISILSDMYGVGVQEGMSIQDDQMIEFLDAAEEAVNILVR